VQQAIAVVVDSESEIADFKDYKATSVLPTVSPAKKEEESKPSSTPVPPKIDLPQASVTSLSTEERILASPLARRTAEEKSVKL
jgi:pyruvate/2-oxoglutarate dehydrogenase complex dihydrolipoamide acyltransferase (E2) component